MSLPLIDKQDNFEIIRDQIAGILKTATIEQQALADLAGKDKSLWELRVFTERSNPWEQWLNSQDNTSPIVNVWFDNSTFDASSSNTVQRQKSESVFNIDCYGYGLSKDDGGTGHVPGDREAAFEVHRAVRLVRNILMAGENTYLQLRGLVWQRMPQAITIFQPELSGQQMQQIVGARLALRVGFNELSPQVEGDILEFVGITVFRSETGEIYLEADYDYNAP